MLKFQVYSYKNSNNQICESRLHSHHNIISIQPLRILCAKTTNFGQLCAGMAILSQQEILMLRLKTHSYNFSSVDQLSRYMKMLTKDGKAYNGYQYHEWE